MAADTMDASRPPGSGAPNAAPPAAPARPAGEPDGLPPGRRGRAILAVCAAIVMATLDTAIANTALPTIAADLHSTAANSIWVINAYQLALMATLLPLAALGEIAGHRRVYLGGLLLFTAASVLCALAWSLPSLAVARLLQGLGASGVMSVNTALIRFIYPRAQLGRGVGINALVVAVAFAVGPTVASLILSVASWPWLFAVNLPFGVLGAVLAVTALPDTPRLERRFDWTGAALNAGAFGLLILAIGEGAQREPAMLTLPVFGASLLCFAVLLVRQSGHAAPMLPVDLFKRPVFALSAATSVCSFACQGLAFVSLPFFFEQVLGRSQVETGFLMTPWPVLVALAAPLAGPLSDRYPAGLLGGCGLAVLCVGMALLAMLPVQPSVFEIGWRMAICGAGFGFFQSPNLRALMTSAPPERAGGASGIVATSRLLGQTTGAALVALCFGIARGHGATLALGLGAAFAGVASVASFLRLMVPDRSLVRPGPG